MPVGDGELPYAPIVAALRDLARGPAAEALDALPAQLRAGLGRLVPELGDREAQDEAVSEFSQARLYEQLLSALREVGSEVPLLLVLEDLHWADGATRGFVSFVARNLRDERLAVVATYRIDELDRAHPLRPLVAELARRADVSVRPLERLGRDDVGRQAEALLGHLPDDALIDELYRRSDGNPFHAEALLETRSTGGGVPPSLRDALLVRIDRLSEATIHVLRVMSAAGRPLPEPVIAAAAEMEGSAIARALREALAAHVLVPHAAAYGFRHSLVRELLYEEVLPGERMGLHARLAAALKKAGAEPAELAPHWDRAGDAAAALEASIRAADAAKHVFAFAEALAHYERALRLWTPDTAAGLGVDRAGVLLEAARAAQLTGRHDRAIELCRAGLEATAGAPERAAAFQECMGDSRFAEDDAGLDAYRAALALLPEDRLTDRARVAGAEARALTLVQRWHDARESGERALSLAARAGAAAEEARARATVGVALAFSGEPEAGERELREALALTDGERRPVELARSHMALAEVLRIRGAFDGAFEVMVEGCAAAQRFGLVGLGRFMTVNAAEDLVRLGRWDEAHERLAAAARLPLRGTTEILHHAVSAQLAVGRGSFETTRRHIERIRSLSDRGVPAEFVPGVCAPCAEMALWQRRHADAIAEIERALSLVEGSGDTLNTPIVYSLGARVAADAAVEARRRRDAPALETHSAMAQRLAAQLDDLIGAAGPPEAEAHRAACRAEVARAAGRPDAALWARAVAAWENVAGRYPAAYCRWRGAETLLAGGGERAAARELLDAAADTARAARRGTAGQGDPRARRRGELPLHGDGAVRAAERALGPDRARAPGPRTARRRAHQPRDR